MCLLKIPWNFYVIILGTYILNSSCYFFKYLELVRYIFRVEFLGQIFPTVPCLHARRHSTFALPHGTYENDVWKIEITGSKRPLECKATCFWQENGTIYRILFNSLLAVTAGPSVVCWKGMCGKTMLIWYGKGIALALLYICHRVDKNASPWFSTLWGVTKVDGDWRVQYILLLLHNKK